ncbi:hypothetical protein Tco_1508902 [Tanacetum coccineum]
MGQERQIRDIKKEKKEENGRKEEGNSGKIWEVRAGTQNWIGGRTRKDGKREDKKRKMEGMEAGKKRNTNRKKKKEEGKTQRIME